MPWDSGAVVSFQDLAFDRSDLVLVGFADRSWPAFEYSVRAGVACERAAGLVDAPTDPDLIRDAAVAFRRARGLVAGDQLRAWLAERGLSRDEWAACLRRSVLRERAEESLDRILADHLVSVDDVAVILAPEAACDGILKRCATTLIGWAAAASRPAAPASPHDTDRALRRAVTLTAEVAHSAASRLLDVDSSDVSARLERLLGLQAAHERFVREVSGEAALLGCLHEHRLAWRRFRGAELCFAGEDAAREALMCLRDDGLEPAEAARLSGAEVREVSVEMQEAAPALASALVAAGPGDVVGPLQAEDGTSRLLVITERAPPSLDDPKLRERARREVVRVALEPLAAGRVRWHGPL